MMNNLTDVTVDKRRRETDVSTLVGYHHAVSNAAVATTSRTFAGVDVFAATVLATVVFQVGKLGIAPIAFQTLLPLVAAVFFPRITARGLSLCSTNWAFYIFCAISLIDSLFGNTAATFVLRYGVLGTVGRTISQLCLLLFFVGYTASKDGRVARVLRWVTILAVISELWFVAEVRLGSPFTDWRGRFYHDTYLLESFKTNRAWVSYRARALPACLRIYSLRRSRRRFV
jgi:hypothetical protein